MTEFPHEVKYNYHAVGAKDSEYPVPRHSFQTFFICQEGGEHQLDWSHSAQRKLKCASSTDLPLLWLLQQSFVLTPAQVCSSVAVSVGWHRADFCWVLGSLPPSLQGNLSPVGQTGNLARSHSRSLQIHFHWTQPSLKNRIVLIPLWVLMNTRTV